MVFSYLCNVPLNKSTCGIHKQLDIILLLIRQLIIFSFRSFSNKKKHRYKVGEAFERTRQFDRSRDRLIGMC